MCVVKVSLTNCHGNLGLFKVYLSLTLRFSIDIIVGFEAKIV